MPNPNLVRIASKPGGLADTIIGDDLAHGKTINANFRGDGRFRPEVIQDMVTPYPISWFGAGSFSAGRVGGRVRLPSPGAVIHLGVLFDVAPTSGAVTVSLTGQSPTRAVFPIADIKLPANQLYGEIPIDNQTVPAGTWLGVTVTAPNGASGISVTVAFRGDA